MKFLIRGGFIITLLGFTACSCMASQCGVVISGVPCAIMMECGENTNGVYETNDLFVSGCTSSVGHSRSNQLTIVSSGGFADDTGGWVYYNDPQDPRYGQIRVNCLHPKMKQLSRPWLSE